MSIRTRALIPALLVIVPPGAALASGAWTTYLRAFTFTDLIAGSDTVWCATGEAGLLRYHRGSGTFSALTREPGGLASNHLTALAFDRSGTLWIGTADAGVSRLAPDGTWGLLNGFDGLPSLAINTLEAAGDTLWIGTQGGIALWNGQEISGALPDGVNPSPFASNVITGIVESGDELWVATTNGVYLSTLSTNLASWQVVNAGLPVARVDALANGGAEVMALSNQRVYRLVAGPQWASAGNLPGVFRLSDDFDRIVASSADSISVWNGSGWSAINTALRSSFTPSAQFEAAVDPAGTYFAADRDGLYEQAAGGAPWTDHYPPGPPGNNLQAIGVQGARVYVGTFGEGFGRLDGGQWTYWFPGPCGAGCDPAQNFVDASYLFALLVDRQGMKWVGSWSAAVEELDDSGASPVFTHHWVGSGNPTDNHTWVWSSASDSGGGRWFGMDTPNLGCNCPDDPIGIDYYDAAGTYLTNYQTSNTAGMAGNQVRALAPDDRGRMWVGYAGKGVQSFFLPVTPGGPITLSVLPLTTNPNLDVFGVATYGDSIWVFSTLDLRLYTTYGSDAPKYYVIPAAPGSRGAIHPLEVGPDGAVWLGTVNGVRIYRPDGTTQDLTAANSPLADDEVRSIRVDPASGVAWIATAQGLNRYDPLYVPPPAPRLPRLDVKVYPNPALLSALGPGLRIAGNATSYRGEIYDLNGRMLRRFVGSNGQVQWDGRDQHGERVRPGLYFLRVEAGGRATVARVTLLR